MKAKRHDNLVAFFSKIALANRMTFLDDWHSITQQPTPSPSILRVYSICWLLCAAFCMISLQVKFLYPFEKAQPLYEFPDGAMYLWSVIWAAMAVLASQQSGFVKKAIHHLIRADWRWWLGFFLITLAYAQVDDSKLMRSFIFLPFKATGLVWMTVLLWPVICKGTYAAKVISVYIVLAGTAYSVPGIFFPPFYRGIEGFIDVPDWRKGDDMVLWGYQLVRDDGARIWLGRDVIAPAYKLFEYHSAMLALAYWQTPAGDHYTQRFKHNAEQNMKELSEFYIKVYQRQWTLLKQGKYSGERYLGKWACPIHNRTRPMPYGAFAPEHIAAIDYVSEYYPAHDRARPTRRVLMHYSLKTHRARVTFPRDYPIDFWFKAP